MALSEKQKAAMAEGRRRAAEKRLAEQIIPRVEAFREWLREDVEYNRALKMHELYDREHPGKRPVMPALPSDEDFRVYEQSHGPAR